MSDLIDRQDLIKALETDCSWEIFDDWGNRTPTGQAIIETIKKLPSASTELSNNSPKLDNENGDLISRKDAIDALNACCVKYDISPNYDDKRTDKEKFYDWWDMHKVLSMRTINDLPSASPDLSTFSDKLWKIAYERGRKEGRKKGKWIEQDAGGDGVFYECSVCKDAFTLIDGTPSDNNYNFCPNCGADMREGEEE